MKITKKELCLYAITDRRWLKGRTLKEVAEQAIQGGVTCLQLREKELDEERFLQEARELQALCKHYHVPFLVNDRVDIAIACDADGVHLGQRDLEAGRARALLGPDKIIGVSAKTVEDALRAQECGADYLGVGAVFGTTTKKDATNITIDTLCAICKAVSIPVVAIGGITQENLSELAGTGIAGPAVISAVFAQQDINEAAKALRKIRL